MLYLIKLPESVRWAWTVGKIDIANQVISKMSEINHVEIPEEFLLKQKPKIVAKNEAGMGSLIASVELRGMYNFCRILKLCTIELYFISIIRSFGCYGF